MRVLDVLMDKSLSHVRLLAVDLDGTLLNAQSAMSVADRDTLDRLRSAGVTVVLATGRSLHAVREVIFADDPVDWVVFSSGAGLYHWSGGHLEVAESIPLEVGQGLARWLVDHGYSFMAHLPIPCNDRFYYSRGRDARGSDFFRRLESHHAGARPLPRDLSHLPAEGFSQFLVIMPNHPSRAQWLIGRLPGHLSHIPVTSPLDHRSLWIEIFPRGVSKGNAVRGLMARAGLTAEQCVAVGNDWNDESMLRVVGHPFVVSNAVAGLRDRYVHLPDHNASPIAALAEGYGMIS